ncbi:MAG: tetratricopeptide repeat protein [Deltaproteobacteria bacterium]|nr:tetratricopeptide repeat protein [Deltaproteobacteria bacterium]
MTLDILGGAVIVTDENGIIQHMSSVAETLTGWPCGEAAGKHLAEVYVLRDEESGEIIENPLSIMHMRSEFVPVSSKYTLISRNNIPVPVATTIMAVTDSEGKMKAVIVAFQDSSQMVMPEQFWNSYAANLHLSALLLDQQGHPGRAEACFKRALLIWERNLGAHHPKISRALEGLSAVYEKTGRVEEAKQLQAKAAAIRAGVPFSSS